MYRLYLINMIKHTNRSITTHHVEITDMSSQIYKFIHLRIMLIICGEIKLFF